MNRYSVVFSQSTTSSGLLQSVIAPDFSSSGLGNVRSVIYMLGSSQGTFLCPFVVFHLEQLHKPKKQKTKNKQTKNPAVPDHHLWRRRLEVKLRAWNTLFWYKITDRGRSLAGNNLLPDLVRQILCAEPPEFGFDSCRELLNLTVLLHMQWVYLSVATAAQIQCSLYCMWMKCRTIKLEALWCDCSHFATWTSESFTT